MKKAVIIIIVLIYVASIALVSFYGLQYKLFDEVVPVERIEITNEGQQYSEQMGDYIVKSPDEDGDRRVQITYQAYPENASNTKVDFAYDEKTAEKYGVTIDEYGVVSFEKKGTIKVTNISTDGSNVEDSLLIISR